MTTVLHLIQHLSLGGASRALIATARHSARLGAFRHKVISLAPADTEARQLAGEAGVEVADGLSAGQILRELSAADIVQAHWWNNPQLQSILHWDLPPMRLVLWYHVAGEAAPQIITPELVGLADLNVASNPRTFAELPAFRALDPQDRAGRVAMVYDAADFERVGAITPRPHEPFNIGYIGTVDFTKLHPDFVPMSAGIRIPEARFVVCGGGIEDQLREQARRLGAAERFDFRGYVRDLRPVLEVLDVYGYPLCEQTYASGELNLQEVMFAGIPPVAFPYGGIKSLIVHESTGLLVNSPREYQQAIEHLFHNPAERERLGRNARDYAARVFGAENAAREINPHYAKLLQQPKRARCWGVPVGRSVLDQPVSLADLSGEPRPLTGAEMFIESLGEQAGEFRTSLTASDRAQLFAADEAIARASRLVHHNGVFVYRLGFPEDPWLAFWGGLGALRSGDAPTALRDFSVAVKHGFPHWRVYWYFAQAAEAAGLLELAADALRTVCAAASDFTEAQAALGRATSHPAPTAAARVEPAASPSAAATCRQHPAGEGAALATAAAGAAQQATTLCSQADECFQRGDVAGARRALEEAVRLNPANVEARLVLAHLLFSLGEPAPARDHFRAAGANLPQDAHVLFVFADLARKLGDPAAAQSALDRALALDPAHPDALLARAELKFGENDFPQAAAACFRILERQPDHPEALLLLARSLAGAGDFETAALTCRQLLEVAPNHADARELLASLSAPVSSPMAAQPVLSSSGSQDDVAAVPLGPQRGEARGFSNAAPFADGVTAELGADNPLLALQGGWNGQLRQESRVLGPARQSEGPGLANQGTASSGRLEPLVSVLVSTCNAAQFLPACLADLERQTIFDRCEIIVVDSGSEQNERAIAEEFSRRHPNVRYLRTERETLYAAWNRGIQLARGSYITNANTDDAHFPNALERLVAALEAHPEADLAYADVIDTTVPNDSPERPHALRTLRYPPFHPAETLFYCPMGCHPMWRRTVFDRIGLFDATYTGPGDYEFLLRFVAAGLRAVHVPEVLSLFYKNPNGLNAASIERTRQEHERFLSHYRAKMPIHRLFRVHPDSPAGTARGWVALGNLALSHRVPWLDRPCCDLDYAVACFQRALEIHPACAEAAHNLAVAHVLRKETSKARALAALLPKPLAADFEKFAAAGQPKLITVNLPPPFEPIEFGGATPSGASLSVVHRAAASARIPSPPRSGGEGQGEGAPGGPVRPVTASGAVQTSPTPTASTTPVTVAWEGSFTDLGSLSHVNREFTRQLTRHPGVKLTCVGRNTLTRELARMPEMQETARRLWPQAPAGTQVTVRHAWPPNWQPPASGKWVLIQPWEFGALPVEWVQNLRRVDEVWVPSEYVRRVYVESGVPAEQVRVVPNGIDPDRFRPDAAPLPLATTRRFKFLFVGGTIHRKGPDVLLNAYLNTFTAADDVCLVIKDFGGQSFYAGQTIESQIKSVRSRPNAPEILYLSDEMAPEEIAGLYTACDCLAHPYRGEGFGLPVLEAMACALPVIVTGGGSTDDFATDAFAYRLPARTQSIGREISGMPLVRDGWLLEPDVRALAQRMRWVVEHADEARAKGRAASEHARRHWTWERAAQIAAERLQALAESRAGFQPAPGAPDSAMGGEHVGTGRVLARDVRPHPGPLPQGEGAITPSLLRHGRPDLPDAASAVPSPRGEGQGEGKPAGPQRATIPTPDSRGPVQRPAGLEARPTFALPPVALLGDVRPARELLNQRKFLDAWNATLQALRLRPFHPEAYLLLAEIARDAGDKAQSARCLDFARELAPAWKAIQQFHKQPAPRAAPRKVEWPAVPEPAKEPRLSVCLIVKNEEQFLAQCLASVKALAHQIVVVDTGSTDRTVEIAREHGAEVFTHPWRDDFSAARNAALEHATGDWVLVLDADEELLPEAHEQIRKEMRARSVMAWRLPIIDVGREEEGCSLVPRLFRNAPGLFYVGRVHEQVFSSVEVRRAGWGLENKPGSATLRHHGYRPEVVRSRNKIERNLALLARAIEELPGEPSLMMNYGLELARSGRAAEGLCWYQEAFDAMARLPAEQVVPELRETLLSQFATHLMAARRFDEVVRVLTSPLAKSGGGLTASHHFALGLALMERKQFRDAAGQMRQCLNKRSRPTLSPVNPEIHKAGPRHCLALCALGLGDHAAAGRAFTEAFADDPQSRKVRMDYARFLAAQGRAVEALEQLQGALAGQPEDLAVWQLGGEIALSRPEFAGFARDWTGEAVKFFAEDATLAEQNAAALLLAGKAGEALAQWRKFSFSADPAHQGALVLCELAAEGQCARSFNGPDEAAVSREFLNWYRKLLTPAAAGLVECLNARLDHCRAVLPSAARVLEAALAEAGAAR